jgi:glycosyltransferase involved in cell wall biosynthesis
LGFYEGIAKAFDVPLRLLFWIKDFANRTDVGYATDEFQHLDICFIGDDIALAQHELNKHSDWHHLFGTYQQGRVFRAMMIKAKKAGCRVAVASEAPCNMLPFPKSIIKELFISLVLRYRISRHVRAADFIINLYGDQSKNLVRVGWPTYKNVACGYYSPPLVESSFVLRSSQHWNGFTALVTGSHEWHRNPMVVLRAIKLLKQRGLGCKTIITQNGSLLASMRAFASQNGLDVEFVGFVSYERLIELYQGCSCFVASGRAEPWGIRVNDALHCGAPLIVSNGMGAVKLVKDYGCGLSFHNNDPVSLADKLQSLILNESLYLQLAGRARVAAQACMPLTRSALIAAEIQSRFPMWC